MTRILAALLLLATLGGLLAWAAPPRADLAEFLPEGRTPASRFLLRELQSGAGTTLLLAAIEGAPREELARLSRDTAAGLRASGRFSFVADGTLRLGENEEATLFRFRYLLSPDTRPESFTAAALRPKLEALLDGLRSAAGPVLARLGFADPTGAFLALALGWLGDSRVESFEGAWFAPGGGRALLLARGEGAGLDAAGQRLAMDAFRASFAAARPPAGARLLLSGPGVFAAEAAEGIRRDVRLVSVASALLLAGFLFSRFRSVALLALVAVPLGAATVAGYAATVALYGAVHAISLGFGMTMLGVVVDYPILLLTLRRDGETLREAAQRIWPTLRLAAAAAAAGLLAMIGSGLPGLVQLGVFSGAGLLTAAAVTRWGLPWLAPEGARFAARPLPPVLGRALRALRGRRRPAFLAVALAALALLLMGGPTLQRDLAALSPVPAAQQALDAELRAQLGAPDVRSLFVIGPSPSEADLLRRSEALGEALAPLVARGLLGSADLPTRYLPSADTQLRRRAALPEAEALQAALREAGAGLPFRPAAFAPFLQAVEESRALPPLDLAGFAAGAPTLFARLSPLLSRQGGEHWAVAPLGGVADPLALEAIPVPGAIFLDVKGEMERLLAAYGRSTLLWALLGGLAVLGLLAGALGWGALAVAAPIGGAMVVTVAILAALGEALSLFHLAALLLLGGLAIDYALFLRRPADSDAATGAVLTCALATLLTFGLLALCDTPVLRGIGLTVSLGVLAAFLLSCAAAPRPMGHPGAPEPSGTGTRPRRDAAGARRARSVVPGYPGLAGPGAAERAGEA